MNNMRLIGYIIFILINLSIAGGYIIAHETAHKVSYEYFGVEDVEIVFGFPQSYTTGDVSNLSEDDIRAINVAASFNDAIGYHLIPMAVVQNTLMMLLIASLIIMKKGEEN